MDDCNRTHICGVTGDCNDYCGGGQMDNLRKENVRLKAQLELADEIIDDLKDKAVEAARGKQVVHIADASELAKKLLAYHNAWDAASKGE